MAAVPGLRLGKPRSRQLGCFVHFRSWPAALPTTLYPRQPEALGLLTHAVLADCLAALPGYSR